MAYKSNEERYTSWWLDDLKEAGYIDEYFYEESSIPLSESTTIQYSENYLTPKQRLPRTRIKTLSILKPHVYTPDFSVCFKPKAVDLIYGNIDKVLPRKLLLYVFEKHLSRVYLEVKPKFDQNNMTREFKINQKWLAEYGMFINLFVPEKIFEQTFTPKRYLLTDKSGKPRKIKWKIRTLKEWIGKVKGEGCE